MSYRYYVTEIIRQYGHGRTLKTSFYDEMHPKRVRERSVDEIVAEVTARAGLEVRE